MYRWNPFTNNFDEKGDWFFGGNTLGAKKTIGSIDNQDFGIITNNTERITVLKDGKIGVGDITPQRKVEIADNTDASLYIRRNSTSTSDYSEILFGVSTDDVYNNSIRSVRQSSGLSDLAIFFNTTGSAYNTLFEALRIKNTTG